MKLVPIEPTDEMTAKGIGALTITDSVHHTYKAMTAECPTVEVVDVESLKVNENWVNSMSTPNEGYNMALTHLKQNGYKLIKETK